MNGMQLNLFCPYFLTLQFSNSTELPGLSSFCTGDCPDRLRDLYTNSCMDEDGKLDTINEGTESQ